MADGGEVMDGLTGFTAGLVDEAAKAVHEVDMTALNLGKAAVTAAIGLATKYTLAVAKSPFRAVAMPLRKGEVANTAKLAAVGGAAVLGGTATTAAAAAVPWGTVAGVAGIGAGAVVVGGAAYRYRHVGYRVGKGAYRIGEAGYRKAEVAVDDRRLVRKSDTLRGLRSDVRKVKRYDRQEKRAMRKTERPEARLLMAARAQGVTATSYGKLPVATRDELSASGGWLVRRAARVYTAQHSAAARARLNGQNASIRATTARNTALAMPPGALPRGKRMRTRLGLDLGK